jgi:hypothetical protein
MKEEKVSTKSCPVCSNTNLLLFNTLNLKSCPDCFLDIDWYKENNQLDLYCYSTTDKDYERL